MILSDLCEIKTNFENADFWINRLTGKPTKEFNENYIGIKVTQTDVLVPNYLFYVMEYFYNQGVLSKGVTTEMLKNLKLQES